MPGMDQRHVLLKVADWQIFIQMHLGCMLISLHVELIQICGPTWSTLGFCFVLKSLSINHYFMDLQRFFFTASLSVPLQTSTLLSNSNVSGDMSRSCNQPYIIHVADIYIAEIDSLMLSRTTYIQYSYTKQCNNARIIRYIIFGNTECRDNWIRVFRLQYLTIHTANMVASGVNIGQYEQRLKIRRYL